MIPVAPQAEPLEFAEQVKRPGEEYLRLSPRPSTRGWEGHEFWRRCLPQLVSAYGGICAYTCHWMPSECSVDHFIPKSSHPALAYEWSNYRLASRRVNKNKGGSLEVLDPFAITAGWFILDMATLRVLPDPSTGDEIREKVGRTIEILKLNDEPFVVTRFGVLRDYLDGEVTFEYVQRRYPFIASEIRRQGLTPIGRENRTAQG